MSKFPFGSCAFASSWRGMRRLAIPFVVSLLVTSSLQCIKEPATPVSPTWDVNLTIPVANRSYTLSQIVEKDTNLLRVGVGSLISYCTTVQASPAYVGDQLTISAPDTSALISLGSFGISPITWSTPVGISWLEEGVTTTIPDTTASFPDLEYTFPNFESLSLAGGTVSFTLRNNLPVPIDVLSPISLYDKGNNVILAFQFVPSRIPAFSVATSSNDLAGRTLTNAVRVSGLLFHTPGSATPLPIPSNVELLSATVTTSRMTARTAVLADIPPQRLIDNDIQHLVLEDSTLVNDVALRSGALRISATSNIALDMVLKLKMRELVRGSGGNLSAYEDSVVMPSRSSRSLTLDLAGYRLRSQDGGLIRSLEVVSSVVLPHGSAGLVTIHDTDKVSIRVSRVASIIADSAVAVLKPTWVGVDRMIAPRFGDLPTRFTGQIDIPSATLALNAKTSIGFPVDLFVKLGARRSSSGDSVFLAVPAVQRRIRSGSGTIQFDPGDVGRFFSSFTGKLPDSLRVVGTVLINPADAYNPTLSGVGTVGRNSSFTGSLDLQVPLMLGVVNGTYRDTMTTGEDIHKNEMDNVNSGKMYVELKNGLPLQVDVLLYLLNSAHQEILRLPQSGQPIHLAAAQVDANGNVTGTAQTSTAIDMSGSDVRQLKSTYFVAVSAALVTTPGNSAVRFRSTDSLRVRLWSQLSYQANR